MAKFSIIIPVYNVAPYLHECLDSVLSQDYTNWELVCIDDGSTDDSGKILDEYAKKKVGVESRSTADNSHFKVLHQSNAGVSAARNAGIKAATGEWLLFLDGDDVLLKGALERLARIVDHNECDGVASWPIYRRLPERSEEWRELDANLDEKVVKVDDRKSFLIGERAILGYPHGRIYRRSLFSSVEFPVGVPMMEDFRHWVKALTVDAKWVRVDGSYYGYRERRGSIVKTPSVGYFKSVFEMPQYVFPVLENDLNFTKAEMKLFWEQFRASYIYHIRFLSHNWNKLGIVDRRQILGYYKKFMSEFKVNPIDVLSRLQMKALGLGIGEITDSFYQHLEVANDRYVR